MHKISWSKCRIIGYDPLRSSRGFTIIYILQQHRSPLFGGHRPWVCMILEDVPSNIVDERSSFLCPQISLSDSLLSLDEIFSKRYLRGTKKPWELGTSTMDTDFSPQQEQKIVVFGWSLGSSVAAFVTSQKPELVQCVLLGNPFTSIRDLEFSGLFLVFLWKSKSEWTINYKILPTINHQPL